jgi:hypothetical protein
VCIENSEILICSIHDNEFARTFMDSGPGRALLVRELNFDFSSQFQAEKLKKNANLKLAIDCKGLRIIKLGFHQEELTYDRMVDQWTMQPKSTACSADKYSPSVGLSDSSTATSLALSSSSTLGASDRLQRKLRRTWASCWRRSSRVRSRLWRSSTPASRVGPATPLTTRG